MRTQPLVTSVLLLFSLLTAAVHAKEQPWVSLFDGKTLKGWSLPDGSAKADDGKMAVAGGSVLRYTREFQDFDLVMDVRTNLWRWAAFRSALKKQPMM